VLTRDEFRALMLRVAETARDEAQRYGSPEDVKDWNILRALATATDAELLGIVGEVNRVVGTNYVRMNGVAVRGGDYIVTPREEGA